MVSRSWKRNFKILGNIFLKGHFKNVLKGLMEKYLIIEDVCK